MRQNSPHFAVIAVYLLLVASIAACTGTPVSQPTPSPSATAPATPPLVGEQTPAVETTVPPTLKPDPPVQTAKPVKTLYELSATLLYDQHLLSVEQIITYTNNTTVPLSELILMVDALYYPGVFRLKSIIWPDGSSARVATETGWLRVSMPTPLDPGAASILTINYELNLPAPVPSAQTRPVPFGYSARQTNLVDWYPFVAAYADGRGWIANRAGYFGEHLVYELSDFSVRLQVESSLPGLIVAASAPTESTEDGWQTYQHLNARNFVWSVSPDYQITQVDVGKVKVLSYAFAFHAVPAQAALDATAKALALFSERYGAYPHPQLSLVEADFLDGMEYDGLYFLSNGFYNLHQGSPAEYLTAIAAHETAHQWFYALVANDQANEPWLDEALCTFHELVFYEKYYPEALDWWWNYRVRYYEPRGDVGGSIYNPSGYRSYRDAVYLNGAVFLNELRSSMGDEKFMRFLQTYVSDNQGLIATTDSFFSLLSESSTDELSPLIDRYFLKWK